MCSKGRKEGKKKGRKEGRRDERQGGGEGKGKRKERKMCYILTMRDYSTIKRRKSCYMQ